MPKKSFSYIGGFWSTNIGNSFYNLGCMYLLNQAIPNGEIRFLSDPPGWFWNENRKNPKNALDYIGFLKTDYIIISGPALNKQFKNVWGPTLEKLKHKRTKLILMSIGSLEYTNEEEEICRELLKKVPPYILMSRDEQTYEIYKDLAEYSYNGICGGFYAPEIFHPCETDLGDYIVLNFESIPEPVFKIGVDNTKSDYHFDFLNNKWTITLRKKYGLSNLFSKGVPDKLDKYKITRTRHRVNAVSTKKLFNKKNIFAADIPYSYLNIYANTKATFSDRVHACAVTLAYGNPAMLFSMSPRAKIFERFNLKDIKKRPIIIPKAQLENEKLNQIKFLKEVISKS